MQRDAAERQRALAEETLRKRTQDLETAQQAVEKLKPFDPASAAIVGTQIAHAREDVQQDIAKLSSPDAGTLGRPVTRAPRRGRRVRRRRAPRVLTPPAVLERGIGADADQLPRYAACSTPIRPPTPRAM